MGKFCDGNCYQILVWENFLMVRVISFWYERSLLKLRYSTVSHFMGPEKKFLEQLKEVMGTSKNTFL